MAIEAVTVAMDASESLRRALFIGISFALGFRESSRVPLSELTGVLPGFLLKKESSNTRKS